MKYTYDYPMPSCTATAVIICDGHVLLIKRRDEPFKGAWALPGGFMNMDETLLQACVREVKEETGLDIAPELFLYLGPSDAPVRDPRGRVIDHIYSTNISQSEAGAVSPSDDAADAMWFYIRSLLAKEDLGVQVTVAFDHEQAIRNVINQRKNMNK